ncbi:hypothetical protein BpHYR1_039557 [Brachionus plicatilis]|uniref:Uncharacterized protein n=1 Tax=Brachionus plicatilis TaxID=10195 RepID=A0A3M7RTK7_BRAPC|nr:hypothetical protein BpHYR1_039557 [Brachionus plicatilis]
MARVQKTSRILINTNLKKEAFLFLCDNHSSFNDFFKFVIRSFKTIIRTLEMIILYSSYSTNLFKLKDMEEKQSQKNKVEVFSLNTDPENIFNGDELGLFLENVSR